MFQSLTGAHTKKAGAWQVMAEEKLKTSDEGTERSRMQKNIMLFSFSCFLSTEQTKKLNLYLLSVFTYSYIRSELHYLLGLHIKAFCTV